MLAISKHVWSLLIWAFLWGVMDGDGDAIWPSRGLIWMVYSGLRTSTIQAVGLESASRFLHTVCRFSVSLLRVAGIWLLINKGDIGKKPQPDELN